VEEFAWEKPDYVERARQYTLDYFRRMGIVEQPIYREGDEPPF
jgi:hypothetical protein